MKKPIRFQNYSCYILPLGIHFSAMFGEAEKIKVVVSIFYLEVFTFGPFRRDSPKSKILVFTELPFLSLILLVSLMYQTPHHFP